MSPRPRDENLRDAVLRAAAHVLAEEGPTALTTRRVARDVGVSTTSVYTYFGSMEELRQEVRRAGFATLDARADRVPSTDDPVADLAALTEVYFAYGLAEPNVYRAMFIDRPLDGDNNGKEAYERLVTEISRCIEAGRFAAGTEVLTLVWAAQVWSMRHGMVTLVLSGQLPVDQARFVLSDMLVRLCVGYGDDPGRAAASVAAGLAG
ncbi:TetR/AcrR family transcriptional regulator [Paractinoplanes rishiriensis]|uniref:TetR family transcriptional regulator n=1 Tax=Paractinoplanes rishiriensis TaxID=1050105 RepID=A0A919JZJ3_9ACTN|nr:TetR/AcrR family transcriptional regulator [Actinoplanes rishiriensis]GIE98116.1 TetR family transcriptional regulator [Actinoplanes rishiriensis]